MSRGVAILGLSMLALSLIPGLSGRSNTDHEEAQRSAFSQEQREVEQRARAAVKQELSEQTERATVAQGELEAADLAVLAARKREQAALAKLVPDAFELRPSLNGAVTKHARNPALQAELEQAQRAVAHAEAEHQRASQRVQSARPSVARQLEIRFANPNHMDLDQQAELWLTLRPVTDAKASSHHLVLTSADAKVQVSLVGWAGDFEIREDSLARRKVGDGETTWRWAVMPRKAGSKTLSYRISTLARDEAITSYETQQLLVSVPAPSMGTHILQTMRSTGSEEFYLLWGGLVTTLFGLARARLRALARRAWIAIRDQRRAKRTVARGAVQVALQDSAVSAELCDVSEDASGLAVLIAHGAASPVVGAKVRIDHVDGKPSLQGLVKNVTVSNGRARVGVAVIAA